MSLGVIRTLSSSLVGALACDGIGSCAFSISLCVLYKCLLAKSSMQCSIVNASVRMPCASCTPHRQNAVKTCESIAIAISFRMRKHSGNCANVSLRQTVKRLSSCKNHIQFYVMLASFLLLPSSLKHIRETQKKKEARRKKMQILSHVNVLAKH